MLPASGMGLCVVVVRVEDGTLAEVRLTLMDLLHRFVPPTGSLPSGSVVLTGSIAHLGRVGLPQYAEDLARHIGAMEADLGSAVSLIPYVPVLSDDCGERSMTADLFDFDCWLAGSGLGRDRTIDHARDLWWRVAGGGGGSSLGISSPTGGA